MQIQIKMYTDIPYGPHERNVLDVYIAEQEPSPGPSPVLVFFHGGGYIRGGKADVHRYAFVHQCLSAGISVVSCNYRFIQSDPYPAPMEDGTRALQFVRHMAPEWGLDPDRIASAGASAGGHLALWNALRGDLARPDSDDPIERQSSAVCGFLGFITQVSKDQRFYEGRYHGPHIQPNLQLFYGLSDPEERHRPEILALAEQASAIHYMSASAPPAFMVYTLPLDGPTIPADAPVGEVIHHPVHGYVLQQAYTRFGIPYTLRHGADPERPGELLAFLQRCFTRD
ncbi:alpha/beta hydrolase [Paenibacillus sp. IB182496]|uniref:Alpha/beta hydrolase n=1 Tax=Paenibacillus sabuli TaxID=2772509 RepID=A0A927BU19_9BACL|nr:alpha/beta hydrolase [Paenibacillus sabuli]MBD2845524.1 alpha/beta hydrolase [Paenibacillus sabuli]